MVDCAVSDLVSFLNDVNFVVEDKEQVAVNLIGFTKEMVNYDNKIPYDTKKLETWPGMTEEIANVLVKECHGIGVIPTVTKAIQSSLMVLGFIDMEDNHFLEDPVEDRKDIWNLDTKNHYPLEKIACSLHVWMPLELCHHLDKMHTLGSVLQNNWNEDEAMDGVFAVIQKHHNKQDAEELVLNIKQLKDIWHYTFNSMCHYKFKVIPGPRAVAALCIKNWLWGRWESICFMPDIKK